MLAAAVYRLSAKNTARIPLFHGRLLHAAFFSLLQGLSPELSAYIHDTQRQKAFAISPLSGIQPPKTKMQNHRPPTSLTVHKGDMVFWRISAWNDLLAQSLQGIRSLVRDLPPRRWHGQSRTVYLKEDRGTLAFEGEFSFDTSHLAREEQQLLLLLAQFSAFSGVGRLTGHGLGQTRARYLG